MGHTAILFLLESVNATIPIGSESCTLLSLPGLNKALDSFKCKSLLLFSKLTILSHCVEANDEFLIFGLEGVEGNFSPFTLFWLKLLALGDCMITLRVLLCLKLQALLILFSSLLLNLLPVGDGIHERLIEEAALVDKGHGHKTAKAGHALVVHTGLAHYLLHIDVLEALHEANIAYSLHTLLIYGRQSFVETSVLFGENIVRDAYVWLEDGTFDEGVRFACMLKLDHLRQRGVLMRLVIIIDLDFALRVLKAADVDSSSTRVLLQEIYKVREIVSKVVRLVQ